jgi:hypothetical protein
VVYTTSLARRYCKTNTGPKRRGKASRSHPRLTIKGKYKHRFAVRCNSGTQQRSRAKADGGEGACTASDPALTSIRDETTKNGPKYLAAQSSLCLRTALLGTKNYTKAKEVLQNTLLQAEKLGLLAVHAQVHAVLAKVYEQEKNTAEEEREKKLALQLFQGDTDRIAF